MKPQLKEIEPLPLRIKNAVQKVEQEAKVILCGSYARGEQTEGSDLDRLILTASKLSITDECKYADPIYDLTMESGYWLSTHFFSKEEWNKRFRHTDFYCNVIHEGCEI